MIEIATEDPGDLLDTSWQDAAGCEDIADRILSAFVQASPGMLEVKLCRIEGGEDWSEYAAREVDWSFYPAWQYNEESAPVILARTLAGVTRNVIARIGIAMTKAIPGGYGHQGLKCRGKVADCYAFFSNHHPSGYWLRLISRGLWPPEEGPEGRTP